MYSWTTTILMEHYKNNTGALAQPTQVHHRQHCTLRAFSTADDDQGPLGANDVG
jgi:hypothetical protein